MRAMSPGILAGLVLVAGPACPGWQRSDTAALASCGLSESLSLLPDIQAALRTSDWRTALATLGARVGLDLLKCGVAQAVRVLSTQPVERPQVAMYGPPKSDAQIQAQRAATWLREQGWKGAPLP